MGIIIAPISKGCYRDEMRDPFKALSIPYEAHGKYLIILVSVIAAFSCSSTIEHHSWVI
jgi:hypothetical protein